MTKFKLLSCRFDNMGTCAEIIEVKPRKESLHPPTTYERSSSFIVDVERSPDSSELLFSRHENVTTRHFVLESIKATTRVDVQYLSLALFLSLRSRQNTSLPTLTLQDAAEKDAYSWRFFSCSDQKKSEWVRLYRLALLYYWLISL